MMTVREQHRHECFVENMIFDQTCFDVLTERQNKKAPSGTPI